MGFVQYANVIWFATWLHREMGDTWEVQLKMQVTLFILLLYPSCLTHGAKFGWIAILHVASKFAALYLIGGGLHSGEYMNTLCNPQLFTDCYYVTQNMCKVFVGGVNVPRIKFLIDTCKDAK